MATSGSKSVTVTSWDTLKFSWSESSQSIVNNTTTISWKLELIAGSSGRISSTASKSWSVTINGTKYSGTNTVGISNNATKTLASGSTTITHNSDGTKTFSYSFSQQFSITFSGTSIGTKSGSGSGTLDTIPRKSTLAASNGTLGTAQTLTVTRQSTSFTHTITYKCGSATGTICTKSSSTSISFTPPLDLAKQNTTGTSVSIVFTITTYNGSTSLGSNTKTISCAIPVLTPSCVLIVTDATGYKSTYSGYVQGKSKFKISVTASGQLGATIKSYKVVANGKTYTSASVTTGVIANSGSQTITVTVTDSRGRTNTKSTTVDVLAYSVPQIEFYNLSRCNADGTANQSGAYFNVKFLASVTSLNAKNTSKYTLKYKKTSDTSYTSQELTDLENKYVVAASIGTAIFPAETASSYDVVLTVADAFESISATKTGSSIKKLFSFLTKGLGIAFGKIAELENVLEVQFQTKLSGGILHPTLEPETDLDDIRTPNTYVGANVSSNNYSNCPLASGTFTLEVYGCGEEGQVHQIITACSKTNPLKYERFYYQGTWGNWLCTSDFDGTLLWSGGYYMTADHTATLSEAVSKQRNGIVLVFSEFVDGAAADQSFHCRYIPKVAISKHLGKAQCIQLSTSNLAYFATKYLYIFDDKITGHNNNSLTGTGTCGITYTNNRFVLRYVVGV